VIENDIMSDNQDLFKMVYQVILLISAQLLTMIVHDQHPTKILKPFEALANSSEGGDSPSDSRAWTVML
jgi:hypothetical protein